MHKSYREESKKDWGTLGGAPTREQLVFGCLLRIADAQEQMAKPFVSLLSEAERLRRWHREGNESIQRLVRSNAALRGVITKLKKAR